MKLNLKGNQTWIFIGRTDDEAEFLILCLLDAKSPLEKTLMLGKIEGRRRMRWQRMRWFDGIIDLMDMSLSKLRRWWTTGKPGILQSMGLQSQTWLTAEQQQQHNLTEVQENKIHHCFHFFYFYLPWSDGTGCHDLSLF